MEKKEKKDCYISLDEIAELVRSTISEEIRSRKDEALILQAPNGARFEAHSNERSLKEILEMATSTIKELSLNGVKSSNPPGVN